MDFSVEPSNIAVLKKLSLTILKFAKSVKNNIIGRDHSVCSELTTPSPTASLIPLLQIFAPAARDKCFTLLRKPNASTLPAIAALMKMMKNWVLSVSAVTLSQTTTWKMESVFLEPLSKIVTFTNKSWTNVLLVFLTTLT